MPKFGRWSLVLFSNRSDREKLLLCCLNIKDEVADLNIVSVGSLNSYINATSDIYTHITGNERISAVQKLNDLFE